MISSCVLATNRCSTANSEKHVFALPKYRGSTANSGKFLRSKVYARKSFSALPVKCCFAGYANFPLSALPVKCCFVANANFSFSALAVKCCFVANAERGKFALSSYRTDPKERP